MLDGFILTHSIPDFQARKQEIMQRIENVGVHSLIEETAKISNTDWYIQEKLPRNYLDPLLQDLDQALQKLRTNVYSDLPPSAYTARLDAYWFQQYGPGDFHNWHIHNTLYSMIVFMELEGDGASTRFMLNGVERSFPVQEGQILVFPGFVPHCSPPNNTGKRKTVIAVNVSFF
jgi:hypothetical protein